MSRELHAYTAGHWELLTVLSRLLAYELERERREQLLERLTGQLEREARTDRLTGIANRRAFDEMLARQLSLAQRGAARAWLALADVDRFKRVNDEGGHGTGDTLLGASPESSSARRGRATSSRGGGDEFAVVLTTSSRCSRSARRRSSSATS